MRLFILLLFSILEFETYLIWSLEKAKVSELGRGFFFWARRQLLTFDFEIFLLVKS